MVDVFESVHAVDAGRAETEASEATSDAGGVNAAAVVHLNSRQAIVATVVAATDHRHVRTCDDNLLMKHYTLSLFGGHWLLRGHWGLYDDDGWKGLVMDL